jgi:hypothetical protein
VELILGSCHCLVGYDCIGSGYQGIAADQFVVHKPYLPCWLLPMEDSSKKEKCHYSG